ncbi:fumarylacetoacetate hydrolase family protein [Pseudotabrizicola algicola]|uniref:Fumarylacetoacetate hydrolase family protein n=1 Tax=Pseudotabrizicola algicola TaxID=2709381 RepID=A0A6B3RMD8_9RHOB|nr:fumarylacetoacetate hydrolase family protein [Pseudotabrizicola algicola]NEX46008.1 fumarylacetoacetate hydrolase family protein [Pseudotabrizicola algicola]
MTGYVFSPPAPASVAIAESALRFPVRRIFCVGRNYAEHAREMGHDPQAEPPFFFTKPADAVVASGSTIAYPPATADFHHEAELVVALGQGGFMVPEDEAQSLIWGHAAGNDLTRRDMQAEAKAARRPWDMSKGFDRSAVLGALRPGPVAADAVIRCTVDGAVRQEARLSDMIWPVNAVIAYLSRLVELAPGDLIMTGTPAGVGPLERGQVCTVTIDGLDPAVVTIS